MRVGDGPFDNRRDVRRRTQGTGASGTGKANDRSAAAGAPGETFEDLLRLDRGGIGDEDIQELMRTIDEAGQGLQQRPGVAAYDDYRRAVQSLLERVVPQAYEVEELRGRKHPRTGNQKIYQRVSVIRQELESLLVL